MNTLSLMPIRFLLTLAATLPFISGCDVTSGNGGALGGGGGGQAPDPVVLDFPIAYVERPIPVDEDGAFVPHDVLDPTAFNPGARLLYKDRASVPAAARDLTSSAFAGDPTDPDFDPDIPILYDVKDVSTSADGTKLLFAMRAPEDPDAGDDEQPTWNIWEYNLEFNELTRVISSDLSAEEGQDVSPVYLPSGKIVFSSNRQRRSKAILLDENKPQFSALVEAGDEEEALVLHVMDEDGGNIEQITYNQSHDLYPTVLDSGEIAFLRWDNAVNRDRLSLYRINPNGSNLTLLYGYHSQNTATNDTEGAFMKPLEMPDGKIMVSLRPRVADKLGGDMVAIDTQSFIDNNQPIDSNPGAVGPAQVSASVLPVNSDGSISSHGYFSSAYPMSDGTDRLMVSWSTCRVLGYRLNIYAESDGMEDFTDPDQLFPLINDIGDYVNETGTVVATPVLLPLSELSNYPCTDATVLLPQIPEADPAYGIWIYDTTIATQAPVVLAENDLMFTDAVVLEPRALETFIPDPVPGEAIPGVLDSENLVSENLGVVHIRNVYELDGVDNAPGGYMALSDPMQATAAQRPARFLRITKAVSMPSDDVFDFDNSAFGRAGQQMKDILGYVPIEPDGSAMFKVPADVAFAISILDENGKRISVRHQNWLTVRPGEVRTCNGCHSQNSTLPHGRLDAEPPSSNAGALSASAFPNTVVVDPFGTPQPGPDVGETMAQYWARVNGPRIPSIHIVFDDDWTDEAVRAKDASFDYDYSDLASGVAPVRNSGCMTDWNELCRTVINYISHIQPLWDAPRLVFDINGPDPSVLLADNTCVSCHAPVDAMGAAMVPAGNRQLDLSPTMSDVQIDYYTSYAELFFADDALELNGNGILQPEEEQLVVNGVPQIEALDTAGTLVSVDENIVIQNIQLIIATVPQYEVLDADGITVIPGPIDDPNVILDAMDNPVPFMVPEFTLVMEGMDTVPFMVPTGRQFGALLSPNGALASQAFFDVFELGGGTVDHSGFLRGAELKLIAEWLDIGGQYYNNPFEAPAN